MGKINTDNYPNRPFSSYQDDDMFVLQDNGGETYTTNVGDIKNLADSRIKLEGVQVNGSDLPISGKKVNVDISGKTDLKVIAFPFHDPEPGEPSMGFFKGAYVTYNGKLYEFTQEHQGAWNPSHVREVDVDGMYVRAGNGGYDTGRYSTTEGHSTRAEGEASHAEGLETIANSDNQHVEGKYNVADTDDEYALIVGNGTADNARSNALTLDWDGNLEVNGEVEDGNGEKISDKTDKVTNATSGHLAGLDSNGNLTDSGVSPTEEVTVEGNPVTFDSPFEQDAKSVIVSVKPIQAGSGTPSPENIRPISGIDEVAIEVSGKNQFDGDWQYGLIDTTTGEVSPNMYVKYHDYIRVKPSTWYTMCAYNMHDLVNPFDIFGYDKNKHYVGLIPINIINNTTALFAEKFQIPSNVAFIRMHIADSTLGTSDKQQLEVGETYTEYEPYVNHTTTIPLPSTLYDADVDVAEGSGENRYGYIASYNGETLPGAWISDRDVYTGSNSPTIGAEVAYELATPTTLSLTPADVELLEGMNVVTTNAEKVAVTYKAGILATLGDIDDVNDKVKTKFDKKDVAKVEGTNASKPYAVGDYMIRADGFYRVTASIASGAAITSNNTEKTTIGANLVHTVVYTVDDVTALTWWKIRDDGIKYTMLTITNVLPTGAKIVGVITCEPWDSTTGLKPSYALESSRRNIYMIEDADKTIVAGRWTVLIQYVFE